MAKKETKKVRPVIALSSLTEYHENVVMLVNTSSMVLEHIDERLKPMLESAIKNVKAFYEAEN